MQNNTYNDDQTVNSIASSSTTAWESPDVAVSPSSAAVAGAVRISSRRGRYLISTALICIILSVLYSIRAPEYAELPKVCACSMPWLTS